MFASIKTIALAAAVATTAGIAAAPASAANAFAETRSVKVVHTDLDLASADGATALQSRVRRAVSKVCGNADTRDLAVIRERNACRVTAMQAAQPKIELAIANARADTRFASAAPSIHVSAH